MGVGTGIRRAVLTLTSGPRDALSGAIRGKPWQGCWGWLQRALCGCLFWASGSPQEAL